MNRLESFIKLESDPSIRRVGSGVMWVAIVTGFLFMGLWMVVAACTIRYNVYWALVIGAASVAFSFFLGHMAYTLLRDARRRYFFELSESECVLNVFDGLAKKKCTQMVLIDDIEYVEYYPYRDCACIILHTPYAQMEVPLWPFGAYGRDVIDFLDGRDVMIVNVQSDEPLPAVVD